jgi:UPF0176 protein
VNVFVVVTMPTILNIAAYHFAEISSPKEIAEQLNTKGLQHQVKGTILVSHEGLNCFLAGEEEQVRTMLKALQALKGFESLVVKESWSDTIPFKRFKVKVKNEIIRMDHPTICPTKGRAASVSPEVLKRWLDQGHDDEGKPVVMLDTRNDFEVDHGRFTNAIDWRITKFTEFPSAVKAHTKELEGKTVVSYCTGGIRCEKAAIFMNELGLRNVLQLDGGILNYFDKTDGSHWEGSCFVFDERVVLLPSLEPESTQTKIATAL